MKGRVLIRKDDSLHQSKGGIILPNSAKIERITARVVAIASDVERDPDYTAIKQYSKVLVNPSNAIPVELIADNNLFVIPVDDIVAVFEKDDDLTAEE